MPAEFPVTSVTISNEVEVKNDSGSPVPVSAAALPLPAGAATDASVTAVTTALAELIVLHADLGSVLAKLSADPATQTTLAAFATANHTDQAAILAKLSSDPATQTTLAAVLAKLSSDPATQTTLAAVLAKLGTTLLVDSSTLATAAKQPALVSGRVPVDGSGVTQPVSGPLTDAQLRASAVPVSGPLTDTQLRATRVPVDGSGVTQPVSGPLTDTQLRASAVPVDTELPAAALLASGATVPTAPTVGGVPLLYNGTTLDLEKGAVDGNARTATGLPQAALMVHASAANFNPLKASSALGDAHDGANMLPVVQYLYNGVTRDFERANLQGSLLASAARTVDTVSADQTNNNGRAVVAVLNLTAFTTAASLLLTVQGKDPVSGTYYDLDTGVAVTANGLYVYEVGLGEGATATGGVTRRTAGIVPRTFRVKVAHGNANSQTYSVGFFLNV